MSRRRVFFVVLLLVGIFLTADALLELGRTAFFIHEAEMVPGVVTDERERPFEGWGEMLAHGNFPWENNTAHCPIVRFSIDGHAAMADHLPDLDTHAYPNGERVELFYHRPTGATRLNRFHLLWGGGLFRLAGGCILTFLMWLLLRLRKRRSTPAPATSPGDAGKRAKPAPAASRKRRQSSPGKRTSKSSSTGKRVRK